MYRYRAHGRTGPATPVVGDVHLPSAAFSCRLWPKRGAATFGTVVMYVCQRHKQENSVISLYKNEYNFII